MSSDVRPSRDAPAVGGGNTQTQQKSTVPAPLVGLAVAFMALMFAVMLFVPARRLDWTLGWIYLVALVVCVLINWKCLTVWNPALLARRMRFVKGTKKWDIAWAWLCAPVMIAVYVVAGIEARDGVSSLPAVCWPAGALLFALGWAMLTWPMTVNPFFEKTVRIQTELGHHVIDTGPYAYIRHPGYVGFAGWVLATPLMLGSAWSFVPASLTVIAIVIRTALEDRTLQQELPGYREYAQRVRFRLIPGIW